MHALLTTNRYNWLHLVHKMLLGILLLSPCVAAAQYNNYGQAYQKMVKARPDITFGSDQFLYNKYFKSNVAVSPYISGALVGGTDMGTAYTTNIRPELERRESARKAQAQYVKLRKAQGNIGYTAHPGSGYMGSSGGGYRVPPPPKQTNGAYKNHWYGGWKR
jgi:hypothetical protein